MINLENRESVKVEFIPKENVTTEDLMLTVQNIFNLEAVHVPEDEAAAGLWDEIFHLVMKHNTPGADPSAVVDKVLAELGTYGEFV